jgi:hypothetical protein
MRGIEESLQEMEYSANLPPFSRRGGHSVRTIGAPLLVGIFLSATLKVVVSIHQGEIFSSP